MYLRLLTSAEIKTNPEIAAFLIHPETGEQMDPESFCNNFVEAVGKEAGETADDDYAHVRLLMRNVQIMCR